MDSVNDKPLEILPFGHTRETWAALEAKKQSGRDGMKGCLLIAVAFALLAVFAAGWMSGNNSKPIVKESAILPTPRSTETEK